MKKLLSFIIAAAMLLSMLPMSIITASAVEPAAYTVSNASVMPGESFDLTVSIVNNPGIISLRYSVSYDESVLELTEVKNLGLLAGFTVPPAEVSSPYTLRWADALATENNTANGAVATISFTAKASAAAGNYSVGINHLEARTATGSKVTFNSTSALVVIQDKLIGDADGDGEISDWDSIVFERYLAGWGNEIALEVLDIDKDGEVTDWDSILLSRYLAGWEVELNPVPQATDEPTAAPTDVPAPTPSATAASDFVFPEDNTSFDLDFAKEVIKLNNSQAKADVKAALNGIGFNVVTRNQRNYSKAADDQSHTAAYTIGTSTVNYKGTVRNAVIVVIRGTSGGEWYSNLDFVPSHDNDALYAENFLQCANEIFGTLKVRIATLDNPVILFTGHSRGAACADLCGLLYNEEFGADDVFVYSFATPGCIRSETVNQNSANIFNIVNPADFIIWLPPQELGFFRPGTDIVLPDANNLVSTIRNLYSPISNMLNGLTIQQYYEEKHSLSKAGLDENGKSIAEEITMIAAAAGTGNTSNVLGEVMSIGTRSDLYPIRQFATNAALSGKLTTLQQQHEVATYTSLLNSYNP